MLPGLLILFPNHEPSLAKTWNMKIFCCFVVLQFLDLVMGIDQCLTPLQGYILSASFALFAFSMTFANNKQEQVCINS